MTHSEGERLKGEELPSPVTTPGFLLIEDEHKFLVTLNVNSKKNSWHWKNHPPYAILSVSLLEIIFYFVSTEKIQKLLRFEPQKLQEVWRLITYMLLHDDCLHLFLNIIMQLLFAYFLEIRHGIVRILCLYLIAGITGVLGASCFQTDSVIGASAGVYALLISHLADVLMNLESMKYKIYRCICIGIIVIFDIVFNVVHVFSKDEPLISWGAHVIGGITGLCLGFVFFKREERVAKTRKLVLFWAGVVLYIILLISIVILLLQIKKCTPASVIRTGYVYFC